MYRRLRTLRAREVRGCTLECDASRRNSALDAIGGSPVADDGTIARWVDQSGAGNHLDQSDSARRPIYRRRGLNGQPYIESNGLGTCSLVSAAYYPASGAGPWTVVSVSVPNTAQPFSVAWEFGSSDTGRRPLWSPRYDSTRAAIDGFGVYVGRTATARSATEPSVHVAIAPPAPGTSYGSIIQRFDGPNGTNGYELNPSTVRNVGTGLPFRVLNENTGTWRLAGMSYVAAFGVDLSIPAAARLEAAVMRRFRISTWRP